MDRIQAYLGKRIDNSSLVFFRMGFGLLLCLECWGAIATGWVSKNLVNPKFTFNYIGFDWIQCLVGEGMYIYFIVMGLLGVLIMLGLFYRPAIILFTIMWSISYLAQKTSYNNHYYLLILISGLMSFSPAHKNRSCDVLWRGVTRDDKCSYAYIFIFIAQIGIVLLYASFNKMHGDWFRAEAISIWFSSKSDYPIIGGLLSEKWFQLIVAWGGIIFDGTIIFLLFFKRTRTLGVVLSFLFHLFNSFVFQIGIFPYLSLLFIVFFYPGEKIRKPFFKDTATVVDQPHKLGKTPILLISAYLLIQLLLPIRHYVIPGDVVWTGEGKKMSWRMMLKARRGIISFRVENPESGEKVKVKLNDYLYPKQRARMSVNNDMIWQFSQRLKEEYLKKGWKSVKIFVDAKVKINKGSFRTLIDPKTDLAAAKWSYLWHSKWKLSP